VPYEAPQGRRVNALGAYFTAGLAAGRLLYETWAVLPKRRAKKPRKTGAAVAAAHGLTEAAGGVLDSTRFRAFVWRVAGRPPEAGSDWVRERTLRVVLDNYSVHKSKAVQAEQPAWGAAGIELIYLPAYSPELSEIEPVCNDGKQHQVPIRSYAQAGHLKQAVDAALAQKAALLLAKAAKTTNLYRSPS
jgi:hypothetical protein